MTTGLLFRALLGTHVAFGFMGLVAFWFPVFSRKGGTLHKRMGKLFAISAYVVTVSAMLAAAIRLADGLIAGTTDPAQTFGVPIFLGYLGLVSFASVHHSLRVIATKKSPQELATPLYRAMAWGSIVCSLMVIAFALLFWSGTSIVLLALSPIGLIVGRGILSYVKRPERMQWFFEHMGAMIGAGIAFHTAFAVFGVERLFGLGLQGALAVIPWIAPTLIGVPASVLWQGYYRRKLKLDTA